MTVKSIKLIHFSHQQMVNENNQMKVSMQLMLQHGENVISYFKSIEQKPQAVETMMTKLNKAWKEFQEKLELTISYTKEGKHLPNVCKIVFVT